MVSVLLKKESSKTTDDWPSEERRTWKGRRNAGRGRSDVWTTSSLAAVPNFLHRYFLFCPRFRSHREELRSPNTSFYSWCGFIDRKSCVSECAPRGYPPVCPVGCESVHGRFTQSPLPSRLDDPVYTQTGRHLLPPDFLTHPSTSRGHSRTVVDQTPCTGPVLTPPSTTLTRDTGYVEEGVRGAEHLFTTVHDPVPVTSSTETRIGRDGGAVHPG